MSFASDDGSRCVDSFEDPAGGFGFEEFCADPEDGGGWTAVGGMSSARFGSVMSAVDDARVAVGWLRTQPASLAAIDEWVMRSAST